MVFSLQRAVRIVALDRFMRQRIVAKDVRAENVAVVPPWSHDQHVQFDPVARDIFRAKHGLKDKFVVMYSGNHSPCHPLETLLSAAQELEPQRDIVFCFVGGGSEFRKIEARVRQTGTKNILCLPYQPLTKLAGSLSGADLQVVVMGEPFVGIIHPSKIYNILAVGSPVLYIGPHESHVSDIAFHSHLGQWIFAAEHGQVDNLVSVILKCKQTRVPRPAYPLPNEFSRRFLLSRMIEVLETATLSGTLPASVGAAFDD